MQVRFLYLFFFVLATNFLFGQSTVVYKTIDTLHLKMEIYEPRGMDANVKHKAIVFFFGGGWTKGSPAQFRSQAAYFASKGLVCFLPDYRVESRNRATPFEALKDAKSAIRFLKQHAGKFHIDSAGIVAAGGSAGGQLAAATALISDYNEQTDDLKISPVPAALVLFNPVIDNGPGGYGYDRIGESYLHFSPLHNIRKGAPPTLILLGSNDHLIPVATAEYYKTVMEKVASRCDLVLYDNAGHGFFNPNKERSNFFYKETLKEAERFLRSLDYITADPEKGAAN
ncbi:alpha/beta hydrolase [Niabella drilacis]|uniref:Acetyl esterase/lipase n=1 Tax=Niabella drilacis (strain DSM 25811 / CCM 8410 / CCUG 62505 / LMG 26954 / E90) TaxID=1285928 RepID=A0A1G6RJV1_NIADE|nr:alpha/beta hydrolase [Niabella drilacis]SDD04206.1 Acetyl esterase/lipase [Niabella drilacis]